MLRSIRQLTPVLAVIATFGLLFAFGPIRGNTAAAGAEQWPDVNNGMHGGSAGRPLAGGHHMIRMHLQQIDTSVDTIKKLGFDPYDIHGNEDTGHAITRRILQAVKSGKLIAVQDATVTGPNAMYYVFSYPGDPDQPFASGQYHPSVIKYLTEPEMSLSPPDGFGWTLTIIPHLFTDGTFFTSTSVMTSGDSEGGCNSWAASGEPILAVAMQTKQLIRKDGRVIDAKTTGVHLVIVTIRLVK